MNTGHHISATQTPHYYENEKTQNGRENLLIIYQTRDLYLEYVKYYYNQYKKDT